MPEKKEPLQGGRPIRGNDTLTVTQTGYNGKVPVAGIIELEREAAGVIHGVAVFELHIRDGKLIRYVTSRQRSFISGSSND